jgi:hypothetical protein
VGVRFAWYPSSREQGFNQRAIHTKAKDYLPASKLRFRYFEAVERIIHQKPPPVAFHIL